MVNSIEIMEKMFDILNNGNVRTMINGGIYHQGQRPVNSTKEDIVINVLSLTTESEPQSAIVNVNIFVPDVDMNVNGAVVKMANEARLNQLVKKVEDAINASSVSNADVYTTEQYLLEEESIGQHYFNVRVSWVIVS